MISNKWDLLFVPVKLEKGLFKVWKRNFLYFKKTILVSLFWIVLEPLMYLGAIGYGLGSYVDAIDGKTFLEFFYPGLLVSTAMLVPFFEGTYSNFTKLTHQKIYTSMMLTPISPDEIIYGEILWCATKGFLGVLGVLLISSFFGLVNTWMVLPVLFILMLVSWLFSCLAMLITSIARNYDSFIYATSGFIIPMSLIAGTYFPVEHMPKILQIIAYCLPLTHGVRVVRALLFENFENTHYISLAYLLLFAWLVMNLSIKRIRSKLIS